MAKTQKPQSNDENDDTIKKKTIQKRTRKTVPRDSTLQRSSIFRGVTRHRWTGRYEAHLWDKNCWNPSQNKKGKQVYLGAYNDEEAAAHAYDLAALKYWGQGTILNFPVSSYGKEIEGMEEQSREEYIGSLRRKSSGFSRGVSKFRGVARHHHNGRWEARIGRVFGNKYLYLGTFELSCDREHDWRRAIPQDGGQKKTYINTATQEEAAIAYDKAAVEYRGVNAVTNFDLSRYIKWVKPNNQNTANNDKDLEHIINATPMSSSSIPTTPSESDQRRGSSFPSEIQTVFDCMNSESYTEGDDIAIFGDLNSLVSPLFQCELDA